MEYVGFILLGFMVVGLVIVYFRRKSREKAMRDFYKEHSLFLKQNPSPKIREHLKINSMPDCCQANLQLTNGAQIPVYWCEWFIRIENPGRTTASISIEYYLAIFFAPNLVSEEFMRKAIELSDKTDASLARKIKDQFITDTHFPFRAEKLADGTFLICWEMLKKREIYEAKLAWLKNNISLK